MTTNPDPRNPLKEARLKKGWTQSDLCDEVFKATGVLFSPADFSRIERGQSFPRNREKLKSISQVLGVPIGIWQQFAHRVKIEGRFRHGRTSPNSAHYAQSSSDQ